MGLDFQLFFEFTVAEYFYESILALNYTSIAKCLWTYNSIIVEQIECLDVDNIVFNRLWPVRRGPRLGSRRTSGIWPPSNHAGIEPPDRDFCPL